METTALSDRVRKYFSIFLAMDRPAAEAALSDGFTFNSPRDDHIDRAEYFERCFPNGDKIRSLHIEQLFENGDEVLVRYLAELVDGSRFRNVEYMRFAGDKLAEVDVYFGSTLAVDAP